MLLDTPGASLFGNMLAGKGVMISGYDNKRDGVRKLVIAPNSLFNLDSPFN